MNVETSELIFHFGAFGKTPLVLFHPPKTVSWSPTSTLFIPKNGCQDVRIYEDAIKAIINTHNTPVYALEFRDNEEAGILRPSPETELSLVSGALLWLRQERLHVVTCSLAIQMFVFGHEHFRRGHDVVEKLRH